MICTAREPAHIRDTVLSFGISQVDAGTKLLLARGTVLHADTGASTMNLVTDAEAAASAFDATAWQEWYATKAGVCVNSGELDGLNQKAAVNKIGRAHV